MRLLSTLLLILSLNAQAQDTAPRIDKLVQQYTSDGSFVGTVLVTENGAVTYARGFGMADRDRGLANGPDVHYRIASISKTFTATIVMKLVDEGKIRLNDPITTYLPGYRKDTGGKVTVHHLLTHSSGIPNYVANPDWRKRVTDPMPSVDSLIRNYCSGDLEFEPGSLFRYSNSGYVLLGAIIEKTTGMSYEQALRTTILDPAGMRNSGMDRRGLALERRATGYMKDFSNEPAKAEDWNLEWAYAAGAMYATPEDMVKWDQILYDTKFIARSTLSRMITPYQAAFRPGLSYGYGFTIRSQVVNRDGDSAVVMLHEGGLPGFNSLFSRIPARKQMVFVVSNSSDAPLAAMTTDIFRILNGLEPGPVKKSIARELYQTIERDGLVAAMQLYEREKASGWSRYLVSEAEINQLGYTYLNQKKFQEAASVFALNVSEFPGSWNVYDSMGECYLKMGDKDKAIRFYSRSVTLNPKNEGGIEALRSLGATVPGAAK